MPGINCPNCSSCSQEALMLQGEMFSESVPCADYEVDFIDFFTRLTRLGAKVDTDLYLVCSYSCMLCTSAHASHCASVTCGCHGLQLSNDQLSVLMYQW